MPRYDDRDSRDGGRGSTTRLYVGHLSSRTLSRDLDDIFSRYGRVRDVDMKRDYAFVEFSDPRDADNARYKLDGREVDGSRIIVEFAKGVPRGAGGSREVSRDYHGRGPPPGTGRCFNCGLDGHWARDCKAGDWKNKCYRCGERGHIEKKCTNSPRATKHGRSYSRSPSPPRRGRGRSRSYSRSPSFSRSRSPVRRERSRDRDYKRSRSPKRPRRTSPSPPPRTRGRRHSSNSDDRSPSREKGTPSPRKDKHEANGSENSGSPKDAGLVKDGSPLEENGRSRSPSPVARESRSPVDDQDDGSPRGSDSE